jgi:hypothetical protein
MSEQNEVYFYDDLMNNNLDTIWMGAVMVYFEILSLNSHRVAVRIYRTIGIPLPRFKGYEAA